MHTFHVCQKVFHTVTMPTNIAEDLMVLERNIDANSGGNQLTIW